MTAMIFINLPVVDLTKATEFYKAVGFTLNPDYSDANASCMAWSDSIFVMLLKQDFFKKFIAAKDIVDARAASEVLLALAIESKEEVDNFVKKALDCGGKLMPVAEIAGADGMYYRDVEDLDGHILELLYMESAS
jgi:predicted lactoylglutathione lyase